jgi:flavin-dependent dehydrogenase
MWRGISTESVNFHSDRFIVKTSENDYEAEIVIGAHGKRSRLDLSMNRIFTQKRSPFVGVKYHVKTDFPSDLIALHNFAGGYCGVSNIEEGKSNICYLMHRDGLKQYKSINVFQESVMFQNPHLKTLFEKSDFLFSSPETINEISFETKSPVEDHILMVGDAAGMITPLCGNGMAMAIHAAKISSECIIRYCREKTYTRQMLEQDYTQTWKRKFAGRLWRGRQVQRLFGHDWASSFAVSLLRYSTPVANLIVKNTHGPVF